MAQPWASIVVMVLMLVRNEAFVLTGAARQRQHEPRRPSVRPSDTTALAMAAGDEGKAKDDIKPTSEDPSLSIKAAW